MVIKMDESKNSNSSEAVMMNCGELGEEDGIKAVDSKAVRTG